MTRRPKDEEDPHLDKSTGMELRATGQQYIQLSFQLPAFYVEVLDREAERMSQRRSTILELLVLRKTGIIELERPSNAPKYRPERRDLHVTRRFAWHCRPDIKDHLDKLRERMGNIPPRSWVILALNEWIGLPSGVGDLDDEPTEIKPARKKPPPMPKR